MGLQKVEEANETKKYILHEHNKRSLEAVGFQIVEDIADHYTC